MPGAAGSLEPGEEAHGGVLFHGFGETAQKKSQEHTGEQQEKDLASLPGEQKEENDEQKAGR